jgi:hypothetical protein
VQNNIKQLRNMSKKTTAHLDMVEMVPQRVEGHGDNDNDDSNAAIAANLVGNNCQSYCHHQ